VLVSVLTPAPPREQVESLTFRMGPAAERRARPAEWRTEIILSGLVVALVAVVWVYFSALGVG
jgi:hypothetical protein